jgi:hypothetical protein
MKEKELFAVFVRALGLWLIVQSALSIVGVFTTSAIILLAVVLGGAIGGLLFFATDMVVSATYDRVKPDDSE